MTAAAIALVLGKTSFQEMEAESSIHSLCILSIVETACQFACQADSPSTGLPVETVQLDSDFQELGGSVEPRLQKDSA